jgi:hypothetical protein
MCDAPFEDGKVSLAKGDKLSSDELVRTGSSHTLDGWQVNISLRLEEWAVQTDCAGGGLATGWRRRSLRLL